MRRVVFGLFLIVSTWALGDKIEKLDLKKRIINPNYERYVEKKDIKRSTVGLGSKERRYYSKYIEYSLGNERSIKILAQDKVSDEQLLYAYSVLDFYLTNLEARGYRSVKSNMARAKAVLVMPNGSDRGGFFTSRYLIGQPQYQNETANIGSKWYIENDYSHRDSTFEEVFHLVHGSGIGMVEDPREEVELSHKIYRAMKKSIPEDKERWGIDGLWGLGAKRNLEEWASEPGSLEAEYIISVIDSYYGFWESFDGSGAMYGEYLPKNRNEIKKLDPKGLEAVEAMLPKSIDVMMRVDPSFDGTFYMHYDKRYPYTYKSRYLDKITLVGRNDINIVGNDRDNVFRGNSGNNIIDGLGGRDVVQFLGSSSEYHIKRVGDKVIVTDWILSREGKNILKNIEVLRFKDKDIIL